MPERHDRRARYRRDRAAAGSAQTAGKVAGDTATAEGTKADSISANLTPFLTQQLLHPQGYSQQDTTQQLNAAEGGAGGGTSAISGEAATMGARNRNPAAFTSALAEAARTRDKAAAGASEGIAAKNADVKLDQQQQAGKQLNSQYGEDTDAMLKSMGIQTGDINTEIEAGKSGWLQNMNEILRTLSQSGNSAANLMKAAGAGGGAG